MSQIWYAAYGSNLSIERFAKHIEIDTKDPAFPFTDWMSITGSIFFAGWSPRWKSGVAFLDIAGSNVLALRVYRLSVEQFLHIWESENMLTIGNTDELAKSLPCMFEGETVEAKFADGDKGKYNIAVAVGRRTSAPVLALTTSQNLPANEPSSEYIECITAGLSECPISGGYIQNLKH